AANQAYEKAASAWYDRPTHRRNKTTADLTAALDKALSNLKATRAELQLPEFQKRVDEMISQHNQTTKPLSKVAKSWEEVLNQPAVEWSTTAFDGKTHPLKDYRGKVVILDFWFRLCGHCIHAMPQVKQIAEHFKDKPVVVLGMNTDLKEEDAKFI